MGGQCMTNQFSVDSKASFFAILGGQFLDLQNAMKFGDVSKVLPSSKRKMHMVTWLVHRDTEHGATLTDVCVPQ